MKFLNSKHKQISNEIRKNTTPDKKHRGACVICDKFEHVTEAHHLVVVEHLANIAIKYNAVLENVPMLWLCPNCHRNVHRVYEYRTNYAVFLDYTEAQSYRLSAVVALMRAWTLAVSKAAMSLPEMGSPFDTFELVCGTGKPNPRYLVLDEEHFPVERQNGEFGDGTEICESVFFESIGTLSTLP